MWYCGMCIRGPGKNRSPSTPTEVRFLMKKIICTHKGNDDVDMEIMRPLKPFFRANVCLPIDI